MIIYNPVMWPSHQKSLPTSGLDWLIGLSSIILCWVLSEFHSYPIRLIFKQICLTHRWNLNRVRVDLGVMTMKRYSTLPRSPELEPHRQMQYSFIPRILLLVWGGLTPCRGYNQHILSLTNWAPKYYSNASQLSSSELSIIYNYWYKTLQKLLKCIKFKK